MCRDCRVCESGKQSVRKTGERRFTSLPAGGGTSERVVSADLEQPWIENRRGLPPASVEGVLNGKNTAAVQRIVRVEIDLQPPARRELEHLAQTKVETRHPILEQRVRRNQLHRGGSRATGQIATERMTRRIASDVSRRHRVA